jgi:TetR/AcrR family transcriptional regulator
MEASMVENAKRPGAEARRKQILEAAFEVFGRKNYNWASTKEIAELAGVSERTIFFYFDNKKELFLATIRQGTAEIVEAVLRARPPQTDISAFLKMSERNFLDFLKTYPLKVKLLFQSIDAIEDPDIRKEFLNLLQAFYRLFQAIVEDARKRGEIREEVSDISAIVCILGFQFVVSYVELLDLDWFTGEQVDIFSLIDDFVDFLTARRA